MPLIVCWHGGGWVIADLDTYDPSARTLQAETGAVALSLDHRQAPEHRVPAAHDDAVAGYRWAVSNARGLGADPRWVAVAGKAPAATSPSTPPSRRATTACRRRGTWR